MANKKLSAIISIGGTVAASLLGSINKTKDKIGEVGSALRNLEAQQRKLGQTIQTFGALGKNVDGMRTRYQQLTRQIEQLRTANERLLSVEKARQANQERQEQLRGQIGDTAMLGAAIALPAVAAFSKAAQFNYDLKMIGLTANMTGAQIKQMGMDIRAASDATGKSEEEIKGAIGFLIAAGDSLESATAKMGTIGRTATAAGAEILDVAKASFTLGDALGISADKMNAAMGALVQSGKEGNFEFKAMAQELPVLAASFQALKFNGMDAVASMGAYLQIARKGAATESEAANNMSNFLGKILSPDTLNKAEKLGSDLYGIVSGAQARGENPIEAAIAEISRLTKGGDQKLLGELFADTQVQNFLRPVLQNIKEYERIRDKALNAGNVVDQDFVDVMGETKLAVDAMQNSFAGLFKTIGDAVLPVFGQLATAITPVVRAVRDFTAANPALVGGAIVAAGAFTTLRLALLGTKLAFTMLGGSILSVQARMLQARVASLMTAKTLPAVAGGVRAIGLALSASGIGLAITAIGVGALTIRKYWEPITAWFGGVMDGMTAGMQPVVQVFRDFYASLGVLQPVFSAVGSAISGVIGWFASLMEPVKSSSDELTAAGVKGKAFGEMLAAGINFALAPLQALIGGITWINNNIGAAIGKLNQFGAAIGTKTFDAVQNVKSFFGGGEDEKTLPPAGAAVPAVPAMATSKTGGAQVTDNSQNTFQIYQLPGQNSKQLADDVARRMDERRGITNRGVLFDGAMAQ